MFSTTLGRVLLTGRGNFKAFKAWDTRSHTTFHIAFRLSAQSGMPHYLRVNNVTPGCDHMKKMLCTPEFLLHWF